MGRPLLPNADPVATPQRLLAAAEVEFARHGFDGARLEDVAERAGIRRASLLYHFRSKSALYGSVVERVFAELESVIASAIATSGDFQHRFESVVRAFAGYLETTPRFATLVLRELMDDRGPGRELLRTGLVPLLDRVEAFVRSEGGECLQAGLPVRATVLAIASTILLHAAAGTLRRPLWGERHDPVELVGALIFRTPEA